ncbi:MAG: hypothetical protein M3Q06_14005 [Bacteroidota bacterium]|nr:hypothetical protein [Bacteroidota bacterium]
MSERIHALAQHLLGKSSIEECSLEEIQHLTKRYPFFAPAQFLLLQKLKATGSPDAVTQQRKAVLYFHDPLQFDHFISGENYYTNDTFFDEQEIRSVNESGALVIPQEITTEETEADDDTDYLTEEPLSSTIQEEPTLGSAEVFPEPDVVHKETVEPATEPAVLPVALLPEEPVVATETTANEQEPALVQPASGFTSDETTAQTTGMLTEANSEVTEPLGIAPAENASAPKGDDVLFEPYHTVDYFASQGIKVTAEDLGSKDKLSKQLRSFTEWLKIMKRLPAAEMAKTPQSSAEKSVENMASHSVEESDVVTEAMAEVWAKQGAREKAIETYNKLSLQNPSKKAYFAAKIENLKGS